MMNWGTILSIALVIVLFVISTILALRLAKRKKPVWAYKTKRIIGLGTDAPAELKLYYGSNPVENVYQTRFIFFNRGNEAIRQDDVTEKVSLLFKKAKILRQPVIQAKSSEAIKLSAKQLIKQAQDTIQLDFLYLDHNDGAVVEVTHTECEKIDCIGNIIGVKKIVNIGQFEVSYPRHLGLWTITLLVVAAMAVATMTLLILKVLPFSEEQTVLKSIVGTISGGFSGFSVAANVTLLPRYLRCRKFPSWSRTRE